jgi:di/tripeptidase
MATAADIEAAGAGMYGKHWHGPKEKMPGEKMKDVWRTYAKDALEAVEYRSQWILLYLDYSR